MLGMKRVYINTDTKEIKKYERMLFLRLSVNKCENLEEWAIH